MKKSFKIKALKSFSIFLVIMLIMTFVSRMVYTSRLPKVTSVNLKIQGMSHSVQTGGIIDSIKKSPVFVQDGLRVSDILVKKGDPVVKGDLLMQLDMQYLSEKIQAMEKQVDSELHNSPDAYTQNAKAPVFTQPGLRISNICVRQGDYVDRGQLLVCLDLDFLNNYIEDLKNELNTDLMTRESYNEQEDTHSADSITNTINEKERKLNRYSDIAYYGGKIYSNTSGVVTDVLAQTGAVTEDSAVVCISTDAQFQYPVIEIQQKLEKLKEVEKAEGKILSTVDGVISESALNVGDITAQTAAFIISDATSGLFFKTMIQEKDIKRISVGDTVTLNFQNGKIRVDDCAVKTILKDEESQGYLVEIPVESDKISIGSIGEMAASSLSEEEYNCLPVSAVTEKTEKRGYIYILKETNGFLGLEYSVQKLEVSIQDKNDNYYGLSDLGLDKNTKIVLSASKKLSDGQSVRMS